MEELERYFLAKLEAELSPALKYHSVDHVKDVMQACRTLAAAEGVNDPQELKLLFTAALFHDAGFLIQREDHEAHSCTIAQEILPRWSFTPEEIHEICKLIRVTRLPQKADTILEKIIADADLDYLGREDYPELSEKLHQELKEASVLKTEDEWKEMQTTFLSEHQYFTRSAQALRGATKKQNLKRIRMSKKHHGPLFSFSDIAYLILSVLSASFALKSFLVPNHFLDGGVTGISILLYEIYGWDLGLLLILLNIPFLILSWYKVGKHFAIRSTLTIVLIALSMQFLTFPELTHDKLLVAMFGGFFMGIGVGLGMRGGGTFDGMEVLVLMTTKKSSFSITELILGMNIVIFVIAAIFMRVETALYAILTYIIAGLTTKYVIEGIEAYTGVTIVSAKSESIKKALVMELDRGITVYKGERGFMKDSFEKSHEVDIIFTVVTRLEVRRLKNTVYALDPKAFIFTQTVREPQGGIVKEIVKH
jgi:uncharacterized membrane-anchored protein YitT (DUF2179 family)/predicted metal-dependent HD superfamily phosphohydrolase